MPRAAWIVLAVITIAFGLLFYQHNQVGPATGWHVSTPTMTATSAPAPPPVAFVPPPALSPNLFLGNPSDATSDPQNRQNYLEVKPYYALSYNDAKGTPNWVSWRITPADLGNAPRKPQFDPDETLPEGFTRITHKDYTGGGFDRGHLCPHGDRNASTEMSYATFCMTNVIPQAAHVNQKAWEHVEDYCRQQVQRHGQRVYVVCGPWGQGGVGLKGPTDTIAHGKVVVPAECWKVIVTVDDKGGDDLGEFTTSTHVLSVDMPNDQSKVSDAWLQYRCSVASIEAKTGLHFFGRLSPDVRAAMRERVDTGRP